MINLQHVTSAESLVHSLDSVLSLCSSSTDFYSIVYSTPFQSFADSPLCSHWCKLFQIFAFGTLSDYLSHDPALPPLNNSQMELLQRFSVVRSCKGKNSITYTEIRQFLPNLSDEEIEDAVLGALEDKLLKGFLNQPAKSLTVTYCDPGYPQKSDLSHLSKSFRDLSQKCASLVEELESKTLLASKSPPKQSSLELIDQIQILQDIST
ncbi:hypothetical protein GEMRC1_004329 [Eukaryota sp. GEM-RC1]